MPRRPDTHLFAVVLLAASGLAAAADTDSCPVPAKARSSNPAPLSSGETLDADADGRRDLAAWNDRGQRSARARLRPSDVAAVLATLPSAAPPPSKSWWQRLREAIESWLAHEANDVTAPKWLRDLLAKITPGMLEVFFWLVFSALVVSLGVLAIVELRAAGHARRARAPKARPTRSASPRSEPRLLSLDEIAALPLREQPGALMRVAVRQLVARGLLPEDESRTNGERLRALEACAARETELFRGLARAVDATVYGGLEPRAEDLSALRDGTHALLALPR